MKQGKFAKYKSWLTSAGIALAIAAWLATGSISGSGDDVEFAVADITETTPRTSVRIRTQTAEEITRTIVVNGKSAPARIVEINAETDGRVVSTGVERGERLDRGEVIVRLDERDRLARLAQAEATVRQRELEFAARDKLQNQSYVSEAQLQEAAAMLEAARTELARARLDIEYMVIRAPFDGALQERHVEVGDYVKAGDRVARFIDERRLIISADVSEFDANQVRLQLHVLAYNLGNFLRRLTLPESLEH